MHGSLQKTGDAREAAPARRMCDGCRPRIAGELVFITNRRHGEIKIEQAARATQFVDGATRGPRWAAIRARRPVVG
jgi:hypothetical protein